MCRDKKKIITINCEIFEIRVVLCTMNLLLILFFTEQETSSNLEFYSVINKFNNLKSKVAGYLMTINFVIYVFES